MSGAPSSLPPEAAARRETLCRLFWQAGGLAAWPGLATAAGWQAAQGRRPVAAPQRSWRHLGPPGPPDALGLCLPEGVSARVVAVSGEVPTARSAYRWHPLPDGGATFALPDGGWVYVSNSEVHRTGGVGALRFDARGLVADAYPILEGTTLNCAGGKTPWGTWLSCEEYTQGQVFECWPAGRPASARARPALGLFKHEAVAVDPVRRTLYLTEDEPDGRLYRFVCSARDWPAKAARPALRDGRLQVLQWRELPGGIYPPDTFDVGQPRAVDWVDVAGPAAPQRRVRATLGQRAPGSIFSGGEGLWYFQGIVYVATKGDDRIWAYDAASQTLQAIYDIARVAPAQRVLSGVDNLTVSPWGDVIVAEDGGNMELCLIEPDRRVKVLLRLEGQDTSELTGPAFSPDGRRLYFSSQRGGRQGAGITYEVMLREA